MKKLLILSFFFLLMPLFIVSAESKKTEIYIFTEKGCPYCAKALAFIDELKAGDYPEINVNEFDMKDEPKYVKKYLEFAEAYGINPTGVPVIYIGQKAIIGIRETDIRQAVEFCHLPVADCVNPADYVQEKLKNKPQTDNTAPAPKSKQEVVGWVVLGVIMIGGGVFLVNKFL